MTGLNRPTIAWRPILTESEAESVWSILNEMAAALGESPLASMFGASVGRGTAGVALFFGYLSCLDPFQRCRVHASGWLDQAVATAHKLPVPLALFGGTVGVGWAVEHLVDRQVAISMPDPRPGIEAALCAHVRPRPWSGHYDLVSGLVGHGVYALARLHHSAGREILEQVVERLSELAVCVSEAVTWPTPAALLPEEQRARKPDGHIDLGLAHGVPGIIALLATAVLEDVARREARALLDAAVAWVLTQRNGADAESCFPAVIVPGDDPGSGRGSRLGWCYGDLGVSIALYRAGIAMNNGAWVDHALAIARHAAVRPTPRSGVRDAGLCHGAAGVAHIFNRLYQATGEEIFAATARLWFTRALQYYRPRSGIGGFCAWWSDADPGSHAWRFMPGLVEGTAGIGLALLAAVSPVEPAWDRLLLVDVPAVDVGCDHGLEGRAISAE